jgi:hypothetical protein
MHCKQDHVLSALGDVQLLLVNDELQLASLSQAHTRWGDDNVLLPGWPLARGAHLQCRRVIQSKLCLVQMVLSCHEMQELSAPIFLASRL